MSDRVERLNQYADNLMGELGIEGHFNRGLVMNAADHATSQQRSCGGACLDCASLSKTTGEQIRVCDMLESQGVTVFREPGKAPLSSGYDSFGRGAAY